MDEIRAGNPIVEGEVTIVPIERCSVKSFVGDLGCWLSGFKEPFAIIVCDAVRIRVFNTNALEIPLESLAQKFPELNRILESIEVSAE